jgi:uncharacterized protein YbcV (DUF1398 family)
MTERAWTEVAQRCLDGAYANTMSFPAIVKALMEAGFEGYDVDYRRGTATYLRPDGQSVALALPGAHGAVEPAFRAEGVEAAVREAQRGGAGYTYAGFCAAVMAAGCAGYMVSFLGRRVVYFGRTAETHVEHFPQ